jgi:hypothetical protein
MNSRPSYELWGLKYYINTIINVKILFLVGAWAPNAWYLNPPRWVNPSFLATQASSITPIKSINDVATQFQTIPTSAIWHFILGHVSNPRLSSMISMFLQFLLTIKLYVTFVTLQNNANSCSWEYWYWCSLRWASLLIFPWWEMHFWPPIACLKPVFINWIFPPNN